MKAGALSGDLKHDMGKGYLRLAHDKPRPVGTLAAHRRQAAGPTVPAQQEVSYPVPPSLQRLEPCTVGCPNAGGPGSGPGMRGPEEASATCNIGCKGSGTARSFGDTGWNSGSGSSRQAWLPTSAQAEALLKPDDPGSAPLVLPRLRPLRSPPRTAHSLTVVAIDPREGHWTCEVVGPSVSPALTNAAQLRLGEAAGPSWVRSRLCTSDWDSAGSGGVCEVVVEPFGDHPATSSTARCFADAATLIAKNVLAQRQPCSVPDRAGRGKTADAQSEDTEADSKTPALEACMDDQLPNAIEVAMEEEPSNGLEALRRLLKSGDGSSACSSAAGDNRAAASSIVPGASLPLACLAELDGGECIRLRCRLGFTVKVKLEPLEVEDGRPVAHNDLPVVAKDSGAIPSLDMQQKQQPLHGLADAHQLPSPFGQAAPSHNDGTPRGFASRASQERTADSTPNRGTFTRDAGQVEATAQFEAAQLASYESNVSERRNREARDQELLQQGSLEPLEALDKEFMDDAFNCEGMMVWLECVEHRVLLFRYLRLASQVKHWYGFAAQAYYSELRQRLSGILERTDSGSDMVITNFLASAMAEIEEQVFAMPEKGFFAPPIFTRAEVCMQGCVELN